MKIKELLSVLPEHCDQVLKAPQADQEVTLLTEDSRKACKGAVFVAIKGSKTDTHDLLPQVVQSGAIALVVEDASKVPAQFEGLTIVCENSRKALALLSSAYYGHPSKQLLVFGVTGTNGKTTSTYLLEHILNASQIPTGVIGTIDHHLKDQHWPTQLTSPGPLMLQSRLQEMLVSGARAVAMEVSSHALDQYRADGVNFNTVLVTNLTRDHLDYHRSMENYREAKQRLTTDLLWESQKSPTFAIVNHDDEELRRLKIAGNSELITFGAEDADFQYKIENADFHQTTFTLTTALGTFDAMVPLCGSYNVANAVGVLVSAITLGVPLDQAIERLKSFPGTPGRLQRVPNTKGVHVFVDYAHSPDALEKAIEVLRDVRKAQNLSSKIIVVFGCGGDRDKGKRPLMAKVAENGADVAIVTSDNPRSEDPLQIIKEIADGFDQTKPLQEVDRREAISQALKMANAGDIVLIAGKGHEQTQDFGSRKIVFSDVEVAKEFGQ